ncbi:MAG: ComEC/Rec2 family competence protein [Bacteroidia bacterium]|nr:ComEC/Rec2 family competence protein [Bacteroidia bacterium]
MLNREIPFLRIGVPLCAGIVCGYYFRPDTLFFIAALILIIAAFPVSLLFNHNISNPAYGIIFTLALFIAGLLLYTREKSSISSLASEETYFSGYLSDYPEEKENSFKMIFKMESGMMGGDQIPLNGSILLYHKKDPACLSYLPGDRFIIKCRPLEITNRGNPFEFDYRFYMENRGIRYYAFTDSSDISGYSVPGRRKLAHSALIIRERIIDMFRERGIEGDRLALVAALTLGQKNMLDPEQKQYFIKAGVMHIMAVSGLHAVILSLFIFKLLFFLKGRLNIIRVLITLILLWAFAFVTGLTPSVLRATIMFTFLHAGNIMKRPVNTVNSVLASAFVLILIRPSVIFDAGFLLSYSAVIFIICFYRDFYLKLRFRHRLPDLIWQSAAVSIVAQAGTLPLTIMLFNRFPTWFILSNIIIVPLSSIVIIVGCLVPLTFPITFISKPLAVLLDFLTGMTEYLTARTASLPLSTIDNIGLSITGCILLTITMFLSMRFLLVKKSIPAILPLSSLLLLVLSGTIRDISTRRSAELIVYNSIGHPTVGIRTGKVINIYSDTLPPGQEVTRHCAAQLLRPNLNLIPEKPCLLKADDNALLITKHLNYIILAQNKPDILIIEGGKPVLERIAQPVEKLKAVIVASGTNPGYQISKLIKSLNADTVHFAGREGAFRLKL